MPWKPVAASLPPASREAVIVDHPERRAAFLVIRSPAEATVELWRWSGAAWIGARTGLLPGTRGSVAAFYDPCLADIVILTVRDSRLARSRLGAGDEPGRWEIPDAPEHVERLYAVYDDARSRAILVVCGEITRTYLVDREVRLLAVGPSSLLALAYDAVAGRVFGGDVRGRTLALTSEGWRELGTDAPQSCGWVFDPERGRVVSLRPNRGAEGGMHLCELDGAVWRAVEPSVELEPFLNGAALGVAGGRRQLIVFGGQDFRKRGAPTNESWWADPGRDFRSALPFSWLRLARYASTTQAGGRALAFEHDSLEVKAPIADGWKTVVPALSASVRERHSAAFEDGRMNFGASPEAAFLLGACGALWRAAWGESWQRLLGSEGGPGGRDAGDPATGWDPAGKRLVVFGGEYRNDTWVMAEGAWHELRGGRTPPHGTASMAATADRLMLCTGSELWRLGPGGWECVARDDESSAHQLLFDPQRRILLAALRSEPPSIGVFQSCRWRPVAELPGHPRFSAYTGGGALLILDPAGDRLLLLSEQEQFSLALAELELPREQLPSEPLESPGKRRVRPPSRWVRRAMQVVPAGGVADALSVSVTLPPGFEVLACLPAPEGALHGGLVVAWHPAWFEHEEFSSWELGGAGVEVTLFSKEQEAACLVSRGEDAGFLQCSLVPFDDLDPDHELEVDTLPGNQLEKSRATKIGGYPRFIQETLEGTCSNCGSELGFAAQLAEDLFDFGDGGRLYVYVCPNGCEAQAAIQS